MADVNFVPDDYVQSNESRRTNLIYLVLFAVVMTALVGSFMIIKVRQGLLSGEEKDVDAKMAQAQQAIQQFEQLQTKRNAMWKTALTTAELIEPVPKSVVLASLTNNLPSGVSLLRLNLIQKKAKRMPVHRQIEPISKYKAEQAKKAAATQPKVSPEKLLETHIDIKGIAPSDLQVAAYIERLGSSSLLDRVTLVESKEYKIKEDSKKRSTDQDRTFRQFKLTAMLKKDIHLTDEDIESVKALCVERDTRYEIRDTKL
jgi:Tfp pilus assembly protein PilN